MNKIWAYEIFKWFSFYLHFTDVPTLLEWGLYKYNAFNNNVLLKLSDILGQAGIGSS